ncbi:reverse transcriptase domain-containing protein [Tanacetum coccineum]
MTNTRSGMTPAAIEEMINQRVDAALEAHRVNRDLGLGNGNDNGGGDGDGNDSGNGNNEGDNGDVYCPRNEIQKMETELWNLSVKNNDMATYTQRFQELTMMCTKMVPEEEDRVEKFIGGLPDNIQGNGYVVRNAENKRRLNNNYRNNRPTNDRILEVRMLLEPTWLVTMRRMVMKAHFLSAIGVGCTTRDNESNLDVEEDTKSSSEFLVDLNAEFHDRTLLANQKRFYQRSGRVGSARKPMDKSNETCFACGKQ